MVLHERGSHLHAMHQPWSTFESKKSHDMKKIEIKKRMIDQIYRQTTSRENEMRLWRRRRAEVTTRRFNDAFELQRHILKQSNPPTSLPCDVA